MTNVCVMGLGEVGYPTAKYIYERGFSICGYDVQEKKGITEFETYTDWYSIPKNIDVFVVAVGTSWLNNKPDVSSVYDISEKISQINKKALVSIESTVPIGTCRRLSHLYGLAHIIHMPHRYWGLDPNNHGVQQKRVIGGLDNKSLKRGLAFYNSLEIPLFICSSIEIAELSKVAENAYRYVQIAFAESLAIICDNNNISLNELRNAMNTKWNINILEAREGIGGTCLPLAINYLRSSVKGKTPLLDGAITIDKFYKTFNKQNP